MDKFEKLDDDKLQPMDEYELECANGGHPSVRFNHWHVVGKTKKGQTVLQRYSWWGWWGTHDSKTVKDE